MSRCFRAEGVELEGLELLGGTEGELSASVAINQLADLFIYQQIELFKKVSHQDGESNPGQQKAPGELPAADPDCLLKGPPTRYWLAIGLGQSWACHPL